MATNDPYIIAFLPPSDVSGYDVLRRPDEQTSTTRTAVPRVYLDAMVVRYAVFVEEQHVAMESEPDADDARSCHWVLYAQAAPTVPLATLRLVPFPHPPHPLPGGVYTIETGALALKGCWEKSVLNPSPAVTALPADHATRYHDGREPYVKIGRIAVVRSSRGHGLGQRLLSAALTWLEMHPTFFPTSDVDADAGPFRGLVCLHAQTHAIAFYQRLGFEEDEGMGRWWEEGMEHVGMFRRLEL